MKREDLPTWKECHLMRESGIFDIGPVRELIFECEPAADSVNGKKADTVFRELVVNAITFAEDAQSAKLLNKLIARAEEFKAAGLTGAFITTLGLIRDCEAIINPGSNMKNGHLCGALCEVCKHADDEESE